MLKRHSTQLQSFATTENRNMAKTIKIIGLTNFPIVKKGDNIARLVVATSKKERVTLDEDDIIVVAHKVVSKAEGRTVDLKDIKPSNRARKIAQITGKDPRLVEVILKETKRVVKVTSEIFIVENKQGHVCINAAVDKSNVEGADRYLLLPEDPDRSAQQIRSEIMKLTGKKVAVLISDTYSRPFRRGQVEYTVGIAGISPFKDYRGKKDLFNYELKVKNTAVADEIASAAELVMGQGDEGIPVAIIKNLKVPSQERASISDLLISKNEDLFTCAL